MCKDELIELMRDCQPSFVITDTNHVDSVQLAASATQTGSTHPAINVNVRLVRMCLAGKVITYAVFIVLSYYAHDLHREGHYEMTGGVCLSVCPSRAFT